MKWPVWDPDLQSYVIVSEAGWPIYGATLDACNLAHAEHLERLRKNPHADLWRALLDEQSDGARALAEQQAAMRHPDW
jgi:hypothetical protein